MKMGTLTVTITIIVWTAYLMVFLLVLHPLDLMPPVPTPFTAHPIPSNPLATISTFGDEFPEKET